MRHLLVLLLLMLFSLPPILGNTVKPRRPNIVFFLVDDLGWRDTGIYGSTFYETPNVDRLAQSGMRFTNGYATCPVCSPSRVSILTGKYPARLDTTQYFGGKRKGKLLPAPYTPYMPLEEETLAEALKGVGYQTFFAGKWHLGDEGFEPEKQGFDINMGGLRGGGPPGGYFSPFKNPKLPDGPKGECLPDRLGDEAVKFLRANREKPFFLYFSFYSVHTPLQTKPAYEKKYGAKADSVNADQEFKQVTPKSSNEARQVQKHPVYAGMMQSMDENVGKVLSALDELGLTKDTIVCFTSDNGGLSTSEGRPTSNLPLRGGKGWLYEGGIRVPFIVRWPDVTRPGSTSTAPVIGTDFYPTLLDALGLPPKPRQHIDGVSIVKVLKGESESVDRRAPMFWHYPHYGNQGGLPGSAILDGDYKLIENFEDNTVELYNIAKDIGEHDDLSKALPDKVKELSDKLRAWRSSVDGKMMAPNPNWKPRKRGRK